MASLLTRYADRISGVLSCFDRMLISGTLVEFCHATVATGFLKRRRIKIFEFEERFAMPIRDEIRERAEAVAGEAGLTVEFIRRRNFRKEDKVRKILEKRGDHPGLVHVFSALEAHSGYRPWFDKKRNIAYLLPRQGQCLHYYFYFVHEELGLCHLRVPTWAPFRVQFMMNGHGWLARRLEREGIGFTLADNAFLAIDDLDRAQEIADELTGKHLHRILDRLVKRHCPFLHRFIKGYHWSIAQAELSMDLLFRRREDLEPLYDHLLRAAIHAVKADDVASFLGKKLTAAHTGEVQSDFRLRIHGRRIRHQMGPVSIKMYDKRGLVLRIETTTNNVSFFKHYRQVEHRDGTVEMKYADMKKTIHSLGALAEVMGASNRRYLAYVSELEDPTAGLKPLDRISRTVREEGRPYPGFNLFDKEHLALFRILARGEHTISGFRNKDLRRHLPKWSSSRVSRMLKRLRLHGMIKKVRNTYKYYLTALGRRVVCTGLKVRELVVIPALAQETTG
jgi:DNA-binding MarR family transcriptional regulator